MVLTLAMLTKIDNKTVQGNGFTMTVPNIHEIRYSEGDKTLAVEIEGGTNEKGEIEWDIYSSTIRGWLPPHQLESLSYEDKQRILHNISDSLKLLGMKHRISES